ncbi:GDSL esterase/lipase 1-like [Hibiscus syriacus]|uniref:GDSL esterase/lipase 1-like n=2 Tax=Hibiscus syriacus TaxID=106335 RepID=A0A6A2WDX6_HIBSY|nr:GDSL esterase/lipase 1-like [Hibiscus syriacus]
MVLGNLTVALQEIYKKGGRKFGFPNLIQLGCLPYMKAQSGGSCNHEATAIAELHNVLLPKTLDKLKEELRGFKYALYNIYQSFSERLNDPSKYGFKNATTACCGSGLYGGVYSCGGKRGVSEYDLCDDPADFFFFDSYHPSEKAYRQFADLMWAGATDIVRPYNFKTLFEHKASSIHHSNVEL